MTTNKSVKVNREDVAVRAMRNQDGWKNVLANLGTGRDKSVAGKFRGREITLDRELLGSLYRSEGLARVVVERLVLDMTRRGFEIDFDGDGSIVKHLKRKGILRQLANLLRWSRLYGGGIGVIGLDDGKELKDPVDVRSLRSLEFLHVFDRWRVSWTLQDLYLDPTSPKYGQPEFYRVYPLLGSSFVVHESRTIRLDGNELAPVDRIRNYGWGDSILQSCYDAIRDTGAAYANSRAILHEFCIGVLKIKNLSQLLASKGNEKLISKRVSDFQLTKSQTNDAIVDANGEDYTRHFATITGLPDLIDRFIYSVSMVTMYPSDILIGKSPSGLQASGDFTIRNYYDHVGAAQEDKLEPAIRRLIELELYASDGPYKGKRPDDFEIQFVPLWEPTEKEIADTRALTAQNDRAYIDAGALTPQEVRQSRFGGRHYSMETKLTALPSELAGANAGKDKAIQEEETAADPLMVPA